MNGISPILLSNCFDDGRYEYAIFQDYGAYTVERIISFSDITEVQELLSPVINDEWRAQPLFRNMLYDVGYYLNPDLMSNYEVVQVISRLVHQQELFIAVVNKLTTHSTFPEWMKPEEKESESTAPVSTTEDISVTNPRWEHVDSEIAKQRPDFTMPGDQVYLYVDVMGIPDGSKVEFDLSDMTASPVTHIITALGKINGGVGSAEWTVEDPRKADEDREIQIEFSGRAKEVSSQNCEIPVGEELVILFSM